jgi:chromobox protein 5
MALEFQVEKIVDSRIVKNKIQYLVKWVGYPESENTWEPEVNVRNAQDAITQFDIEFSDKEYPEPVAEKPTAAKKSPTPAPEPAPETSPEQAAPVAVMT